MSQFDLKNLIPREIENNEIRCLLKRFSMYVDHCIDFGAKILFWDLQNKILSDADLPILLMLRHFLELLDAISILISNSSIETCRLLLRGLLETSMGIEYLLEKDTEKRSIAFLVWHMKQDLKFYRKHKKEPEKEIEFLKNIMKDKLVKNYTPPDMNLLNYKINEIVRILEKPQYQQAVEEYNKLAEKKEKNPPWYRLFDGPKNARKLAEYLSLPVFYDYFYRKNSGVLHGTDILKGKIESHNGENIKIIQIRNPQNAQDIIKETMTIAIRTLHIIIARRLPNRDTDFNTWYQTIQAFYRQLHEKKMIITE